MSAASSNLHFGKDKRRIIDLISLQLCCSRKRFLAQQGQTSDTNAKKK